MKKNISSKKIVLSIILGVLGFALIILGVFVVYVSQEYKTEQQVEDAIGASIDVQVTIGENMLIFTPSNITPREGIIFYPGNRIEYKSYAPMLKMIASQGFMCVLVKVPYNMSLFDKNAANRAIDKFKFVTDWYVGGHGFGGTTAAKFAANNKELVKGVILLGSYSTVDLSDSGLKAISLYGTKDKIMNLKKYKKYKDMLPKDFTEVVMEGGNHASFGYYGDHKEDGTATITKYQQQVFSAINIIGFITGDEVTTTLEEIAVYENKK